MNKERSLAIILQYLQMALSIIINLIYTPLMIRILGDSEFGLYSLTSSIVSYLSLLSLGFGASYIRFYSRYKKNNEENNISKLNGLFMLVFLIIGLISLLAGLFLSYNVKTFFNESYSLIDLKKAKTMMIFLSINLAISFPASVFVSYITSQEKFIIQKILNIGKTVVSPCICIVFLFLGYGSVGMVIVTTVISLIIDLINISYCFIRLKMKFSFKKIDKLLFKEVAIFSSFIAVNQIIDQINWQTDKLILGKMANSSVVAIYTIGATINTMYTSFSTAISSVFVPQVHKIVSENENNSDKQLVDLMIKVGRLQFLIICLILTGFIFFGRYFIIKWAGEAYNNSYYITLLLIIPVTIPLIQNLGIEIQRAKNKHKFRSIVYGIMAIINVGISILLCSLWGAIGTALGTTLSLIIANGIVMNIYYHKILNLNMAKFWMEIIKILPALVLPIIFGLFINIFCEFSNLKDFCLMILCYSLLYFLSMYFFGISKNDRHEITTKIRLLFKEKSNIS